MNNAQAVNAVSTARRGNVATVDFVAPILSAMLAAESLREAGELPVQFSGDSATYAESNGLRDALEGNYRRPVRGGLQGQTYSQLARLQSPEDVDFCNTIIADLLYYQLGDQQSVAAELAKIVGELHDNVVSHAAGAGFSSAQVYKQQDHRSRIEYAIADVGRGFLYNARTAQPEIATDQEAIQWAVRKGTTSGRVNDWAQRLPSDVPESPYPPSTDTTYTENHHLGLGLYDLCEVVRKLGGQLWICSGRGMTQFVGDRIQSDKAAVEWQGVAIEFEVVA